MAKLDYEKVKKQIVDVNPDIDVDKEVKTLRDKLTNISPEGALLIIANKAGVKVITDKPKATIKTIDTLKSGDDYVEIAGVCVSTYPIRFYEVCPDCAKRIKEQAGVFKCEVHGVIASPAYSFVMNMLMDDGTGNIRLTLFSKQLQRLLGMDAQQILKYRNDEEGFKTLQNSMLGKMFAFRGKVKQDEFQKQFTAMYVFKEPKDVQPRVDAISSLVKQRDKIPEPESDVEEIHIE